MANTPPTPLMAALAAYKQGAQLELSPDELQEGVRLLKEVNRRLPNRNLLDTNKDALRNAGKEVLAVAGGPAHQGKLLSRELRRFYDAAFGAELINRHPLTADAQLPTTRPDTTDGRQAGAKLAAEIVTGLIEEGIQAGMMLSPLALPASELGGGQSKLDTFVQGLEGRWAELAARAKGLLSFIRIALPVVSILLAVSTVISGKDPLGSRMNSAFSTGNAMQMLKIMIVEFDGSEMDSRSVESMEDLERVARFPLDDVEKTFEFEAMRFRPTILFLRHRDSGVLVMIDSEQRATLAGDRIRVRE